MSPELMDLVERARSVRMTEQDMEEQRRSFAFGSANIENSDVTRAIVDEAADRLKESQGVERPLK